MSQFDYQPSYTRNRPHIHPAGAMLFVTFRLAGSIPKSVIRQHKSERILREREIERLENSANRPDLDADTRERMIEFHRKWFKRYDEILDKAKYGPMWLSDAKIRNIVSHKILADDPSKYRLDAFCIMSNHAHIVFKPTLNANNLAEVRTNAGIKFVSEEDSLASIMQSLKGVTARGANLLLGRTGSFWEKESFDHFIRDEAGFYRAVKYTINNPVKAGLVKHWTEWPGSYLAPRLRDEFK